MKKILIDSNVLLDILNEDKVWYDWSAQKFKECMDKASVIINPIVFAETSVTFPSLDKFQKTLEETGLIWANLSKGICFLAGKVHNQYRKNGGNKLLPLPDFFIGAHASVEKMPLLTRDVSAYRTYFPNIKLIAPDIN